MTEDITAPLSALFSIDSHVNVRGPLPVRSTDFPGMSTAAPTCVLLNLESEKINKNKKTFDTKIWRTYTSGVRVPLLLRTLGYTVSSVCSSSAVSLMPYPLVRRIIQRQFDPWLLPSYLNLPKSPSTDPPQSFCLSLSCWRFMV